LPFCEQERSWSLSFASFVTSSPESVHPAFLSPDIFEASPGYAALSSPKMSTCCHFLCTALFFFLTTPWWDRTRVFLPPEDVRTYLSAFPIFAAPSPDHSTYLRSGGLGRFCTLFYRFLTPTYAKILFLLPVRPTRSPFRYIVS